MSTGLIALLDDVAGLAKVAAASLDDVGAQAVKAGAKAAGVVIDDAAVTPRYVVGFSAAREVPIVTRIALGSLRNKLLFLLPGALVLSFVAPWAITPLLMLGGAYLCYEGAEKVWHAVAPHGTDKHEAAVLAPSQDPQALENAKVRGAIGIDFVLSAEIMAITLGTLPDVPLWEQAVVLAIVGIRITLGVYGVAGLIVKADDLGLAMAAGERPNHCARAGWLRAVVDRARDPRRSRGGGGRSAGGGRCGGVGRDGDGFGRGGARGRRGADPSAAVRGGTGPEGSAQPAERWAGSIAHYGAAPETKLPLRVTRCQPVGFDPWRTCTVQTGRIRIARFRAEQAKSRHQPEVLADIEDSGSGHALVDSL